MINDYDIILHENEKSVNFNPDEWEEMTVGEFYKRENISEEEQIAFKNSRFATNMHFMLANETYEDLLETLDDIKKDHRLAKLNAIVILSLKKKGRGVGYTKVSQEGFGFLVNRMLRMNIPFGFDSCSARKFEKAVSNYPNAEKMITMSVPCESTLESSYVDVNGDFFPCSFTEGSPDWKTGISVLECNDFIKDIWYSERTQGFRDKLIANCRNCPIYEV